MRSKAHMPQPLEAMPAPPGEKLEPDRGNAATRAPLVMAAPPKPNKPLATMVHREEYQVVQQKKPQSPQQFAAVTNVLDNEQQSELIVDNYAWDTPKITCPGNDELMSQQEIKHAASVNPDVLLGSMPKKC